LVHESLPNVDVEFPGLPRDRSIQVYSDIEQVTQHLTDPRFEFVSSVEEADIICTKHYLKDFKLVIIEIILWNILHTACIAERTVTKILKACCNFVTESTGSVL